MKVLITGSAGFIGFHTVKRYLDANHEVIGLDNINDYYSTKLKYDRLRESGIEENLIKYNQLVKSKTNSNYQFIKLDLEDAAAISYLFSVHRFDMVVHLAAQAGVRYSIENPRAYIQSNMVGFFNILESCHQHHVKTFLYASSSSIYGLSENEKLSTKDKVDNPISLYAATKKSNELMAHVYSHLYNMDTIGLRFFTVYGPWGRPDMAPFLFTDSIINEKTIKVFNHGNMKRDFTFIDDIVEGIYGVSVSALPNKYNIFNIGNNSPIKLLDFITCLESELQREAQKEMHDMQPGDVLTTWADTTDFIEVSGYTPKVEIAEGVKQFIQWYKSYYHIH